MNLSPVITKQQAMPNSCTLNQPVLRPVAADDILRSSLEDFITGTYQQFFNAELNSFLPNLVAATTANDEIQAAFGYSDAGEDRLFLENYIDQPVDLILSKKLDKKIQRKKIVEVGNLAITDMTESISFLREIARYLQGLGYEWIICTATRYLRLLFLRSGCKPLSIATASVSRVKDDGTDWGSYYATAPEVLVGNVNQSIYLIEQKLLKISRQRKKHSNALNFVKFHHATF